MSEKKRKPYAVTLTVKPKPQGISKYSSKTYRGMAMALNPKEAKELSIAIVLENVKVPIITREEIFIKDCKLHADFFTTDNML